MEIIWHNAPWRIVKFSCISLKDFFIEVFYSPKYQKVLMINAFEKAIGLDPYLDKISLSDLITV